MIATIVMTITCILIPVAVLVLIALGIAIPFGTIALGLEVGKRVSESFKQNWTPPLQAGVGTFILSLVSGVIDIIPCVGWIVPFLIFSIGLGAVILTRFGSQAYMPKILWRVTRLYSSVVDETLDPLIERSGDFYVFFRQMNNMLYSSLLYWQLQNSDRLE
jgi:hypothetical protein